MTTQTIKRDLVGTVQRAGELKGAILALVAEDGEVLLYTYELSKKMIPWMAKRIIHITEKGNNNDA